MFSWHLTAKCGDNYGATRYLHSKKTAHYSGVQL